MEKDKAYFSDVLVKTGLWPQIQYHFDLDFGTKAGDVLIFDEGDEHLFGSPTEFVRLTQARKCIVYTGTYDDGKEGYEHLLLKHMKFIVFSGRDVKLLLDPVPLSLSTEETIL